MYKAQAESGQSDAGAGQAPPEGEAESANTAGGDDVQDVDFEEVKE